MRLCITQEASAPWAIIFVVQLAKNRELRWLWWYRSSCLLSNRCQISCRKPPYKGWLVLLLEHIVVLFQVWGTNRRVAGNQGLCMIMIAMNQAVGMILPMRPRFTAVDPLSLFFVGVRDVEACQTCDRTDNEKWHHSASLRYLAACDLEWGFPCGTQNRWRRGKDRIQRVA